MSAFVNDLRYGLRMMARNPGFTIAALLTLALGIGANTAIFTVVDAWVLRPLPYADAGRLLSLWETRLDNGSTTRTAPANYLDWREQSRVFDELCPWTHATFNLTGVAQPERLKGAEVGANFFRLLGVTPALGRDFRPEEEREGGAKVVILSHAFWRDRFAARPEVIGRTLLLDDVARTVIGVMPESFHMPLMGRTAAWTPLVLTGEQRATRNVRWLNVMARLKADVELAQAQAEMDGIAQRLAGSYRDTNARRGIKLMTLHDDIGQHAGNEAVMILFAIVGCVLLIACANVANLLLARGAARQKEIAVRLAIGAGRGRLLRQLLAENLLLFLAAAGLGVVIAVWVLDAVSGMIPYENRGYLRDYAALSIDLRVLVFTLLTAVLTGLLFGLTPALDTLKLDLHATLKESGGRGSGGVRGSRVRNILVAGEIALAGMVLVAGALLAQSFVRMHRVDPGFRSERLLMAALELPRSSYGEAAQSRAFYERVLERIAALPQVEAAAASRYVPFGSENSSAPFLVENRPAPDPAEVPVAMYSSITPGYLATMGMALVRGRAFTAQDGPDAPPVVLINETLARRYFAGEDPVGRRVRFDRGDTRWRAIAGVIKDVTMVEFVEPRRPQILVPYAQASSRDMALVVRTAGDPATVAAAIRGAVWSVDRAQPVSEVRTFERLIHEVHAPYRIVSQMMGAFALLALFLAAIGVYGVMAYSVSRRTQEIGIRVALGAARRDVVALIVKQGLTVALAGIAAGLAAALALSRALSSLLFGVTARDPATFLGVGLLLAGVALAACLLPARRALKVDPLEALRYE